MRGMLYVVGVGPGDPELMTIKAYRTIQSADVIACPSRGNVPGTAYQIAEQIVPELEQKEILPLHIPMTGEDLSREYQEAAALIQEKLDAGKRIACLTLGDPGFYSTVFHFLDRIVSGGYAVEVISAVPSFCAASARLQIPLALGEESVLITTGDLREYPGTQVIMKAGSHLGPLKEQIRSQKRSAALIENCGMDTERVYNDVEEFPDQAGYFSILIVR